MAKLFIVTLMALSVGEYTIEIKLTKFLVISYAMNVSQCYFY